MAGVKTWTWAATVIPHIILFEVIIILLFKKKIKRNNCWAIGIFFLLVIAAR